MAEQHHRDDEYQARDIENAASSHDPRSRPAQRLLGSLGTISQMCFPHLSQV
jgi:hypothetical protein